MKLPDKERDRLATCPTTDFKRKTIDVTLKEIPQKNRFDKGLYTSYLSFSPFLEAGNSREMRT